MPTEFRRDDLVFEQDLTVTNSIIIYTENLRSRIWQLEGPEVATDRDKWHSLFERTN